MIIREHISEMNEPREVVVLRRKFRALNSVRLLQPAGLKKCIELPRGDISAGPVPMRVVLPVDLIVRMRLFVGRERVVRIHNVKTFFGKKVIHLFQAPVPGIAVGIRHVLGIHALFVRHEHNDEPLPVEFTLLLRRFHPLVNL